MMWYVYIFASLTGSPPLSHDAQILTNHIQLSPQLLKAAVTKSLNDLLAPIHADFTASKEWQEIAIKAYPPPAKKEKKVKDKGTRHPVKAAENIDVKDLKEAVSEV